MPRTEKQFEEIRKQKKELILESALELFAEHGFHATSISQIAKKAKISKGLIYSYFESKKEILQVIILNAYHSIYSNFDLDNDGTLTEEEFIFFIRRSFEIVRQNNNFWKLYISLVTQPKILESVQNEILIEKSKPILDTFYKFIHSKNSDDPQETLLVISSLLKGAFMLMITNPEFFTIHNSEEKIIETCMNIINRKI